MLTYSLSSFDYYDNTYSYSICLNIYEDDIYKDNIRQAFTPNKRNELLAWLEQYDLTDKGLLTDISTKWTDEVVSKYNANIAESEPELTLDGFKVEASNIIESYINDVAKARGYDSALSCTSYVSSTIPQWKTEADTFIAWRDSVWNWAFSQFSQIQSGQLSIPTLDQVTAHIPQITWPS